MIRSEIAEGICTISFARPEKKNAFTTAMYTDLNAALLAADKNADVRVILLRGDGGSFTAGNDLKDFQQNPPLGKDSPVMQLLLLLGDLEKPLVAQVQGAAVGIGVTLLLQCDLAYADMSAKFAMPFVDLGLSPEGGSTFLLPRIMGLPKASELLLCADRFDAVKAKELGIIADVYPERLDERVMERATLLAAKPAASLRASKKLLRASYRDRLRQTILDEADIFAERLQSPEAAEAFAAFFEKRNSR